jgi:hypothetical protein
MLQVITLLSQLVRSIAWCTSITWKAALLM